MIPHLIKKTKIWTYNLTINVHTYSTTALPYTDNISVAILLM